MSKSGAFVGIDLGTTYSLVAAFDGKKPRVIPNAVGETLTPSAVSISERGEVLVGAPARARAATHPEQTALSFKRDMGVDRKWRLEGRVLGPEELSALVLRTLREDAEAALGNPVVEAVVTVPAYFGELQRRATKNACDMAGLPVERIINEPTAAALAYGLHQREREFRAVVLDLGGGTFDVTVLEVIEGVIEIQATAGDSRLGGDDFVDALLPDCCRTILEQHGVDPSATPVDRARLREALEHAKKRLSSSDRVRVPLPGFGPSRTDIELELDLTDAERSWEPLLERIRGPIRRALRDAGTTPESIDEVLLVGGATRMPCIPRLAATLFGKLPSRSLPADEAVALGAAVQVALKQGDTAVSDMVVTDIAPFTLGMSVGERMGTQQLTGLFAPILERGTVLPASRVKTFATLSDGQTAIKIKVYQGEHSLCRDNQMLGEYEVKGIPRGPAEHETVDVRFTYDLNGILQVDTTINSTGKTHSLEIQRAPGRLDRKRLAETRKRLRALKFHPREALPNVTALARAEALYVELSGIEREILGEALTRFRGELETQDPARIAEARQALMALIPDLRT